MVVPMRKTLNRTVIMTESDGETELKAAIDASLGLQRRTSSQLSASCDLTGSGSDDESVWLATPKKKIKLSAAEAASAVKIEDDYNRCRLSVLIIRIESEVATTTVIVLRIQNTAAAPAASAAVLLFRCCCFLVLASRASHRIASHHLPPSLFRSRSLSISAQLSFLFGF